MSDPTAALVEENGPTEYQRGYIAGRDKAAAEHFDAVSTLTHALIIARATADDLRIALDGMTLVPTEEVAAWAILSGDLEWAKVEIDRLTGEVERLQAVDAAVDQFISDFRAALDPTPKETK